MANGINNDVCVGAIIFVIGHGNYQVWVSEEYAPKFVGLISCKWGYTPEGRLFKINELRECAFILELFVYFII
jgi:hypothetical protein